MKIAILSPHADDAELGCGGSLAKFIEEGHELFWLVFSIAEESLPEGLPRDTLQKEFLKVVKGLNLKEDSYKILNFKVRNLHEHRQEILEELIILREEFQPGLVIGPSLNDFHQDHQVVANEMVRAFKAASSIICYELPWNHVTFNTQLLVKLNKGHIRKKCEMLNKYKSQKHKGRVYFSRGFVFGLAKTRGVQCHAECAEAFEVIRWII